MIRRFLAEHAQLLAGVGLCLLAVLMMMERH